MCVGLYVGGGGGCGCFAVWVGGILIYILYTQYIYIIYTVYILYIPDILI